MSKKYKFKHKIVPLDLAQSLMTQEKILNDFGMKGWKAIGVMGRNGDLVLMTKLLPKREQEKIIL